MSIGDRDIGALMDALDHLVDDFDFIMRSAHAKYRSLPPDHLIELDSRAQSACTYSYIVAEADRKLAGREDVVPMEVRGLKLWLLPKSDIVIRFKKTDEDGIARNYPTKQAKDFDRGFDLPGLPMPPVRLTAGYVLDATSTNIERTQIVRPVARRKTLWCAAIVPMTDRVEGMPKWWDVTRQGSL